MSTHGQTTLPRAREIFESSLSSLGSQNLDPRFVKDDLVYLKEFASKLKFQYLEQESRDKFLRLLLMESNTDLDPKDVDRLTAKNVAAKADLKELKAALHSFIETSDSIAEDVLSLNRLHQRRQGELDGLQQELEDLEGELEAMTLNPDNENLKLLFDLDKIIGSEDVSLPEAISIAEVALDQEKIAYMELNAKEVKVQQARSDQLKLVLELQRHLEELQRANTASQEPRDEDDEPDQVYARGLKRLNELLLRFSNQEVKVEQSGQTVTVRMSGGTLSLDLGLDIVGFSNLPLTQTAIDRVNCVTGGQKFWKLARLISAIIDT